MTCAPQVFRTEHWSRTLGARRALPLMAAVLSTTCLLAVAATLAAHPGQVGRGASALV